MQHKDLEEMLLCLKVNFVASCKLIFEVLVKVTPFSPWNESDDIPEENSVNTKAFASFSDPFLLLEGRLSSWHHQRLEAGGWELPAAPVTVPAKPVWLSLTCPARLCLCHEQPLPRALQSCFCTQLSLCCQGSAAELSWAGQVSFVLQEFQRSQAGSVPCQSLCEGSWWHPGVPLLRGCWQTLPQKEQ